MKLLSVALLAAVPFAGSSQAAIDFKKQVRPVLEAYCLKCHGDEKPKGKLSLTTRAGAVQGGEKGASIVPGDPAKSSLYTLTTLPAGHDDVMPPKGDLLTREQQDTLKQWIVEGAAWPDSIRLQQREKVDFVKQAKPVLEVYCVACHKEGHAKGDLRLDVREEFLKSKDVVPGDALASKVYTSMVLPADHDDLMPPRKKGGPLPAAKCDVIRDWIDQGAVWPAGLVLKEREPDASTDRDWNAVIAAIHARLIKNQQAAPLAHKNYRETIHESVGFEMVAIPGGEFEMGSADSSPGHQPNESPRHKVKLDPFWMGKTEVTWNEYELFQFPSMEKGANVSTERVNRELLLLTEFPRPSDGGNPYVGHEADAVSRPTTPYVEMSFGMGKDGFPAISMTHYAALMYCRWLSAKTGHFYRLATEAEWEYAARAGSTTTYYWGDDPAKAGEYAWYFDNADGKYQKVGLKKPNRWGLYDMSGNVWEWVWDWYDSYPSSGVSDPIGPRTGQYRVLRGGAWGYDAVSARVANRHDDPPGNRGRYVGFRVARSLPSSL